MCIKLQSDELIGPSKATEKWEGQKPKFGQNLSTGWGLSSGTANGGYSEAVFEAMTKNFCYY